MHAAGKGDNLPLSKMNNLPCFPSAVLIMIFTCMPPRKLRYAAFFVAAFSAFDTNEKQQS